MQLEIHIEPSRTYKEPIKKLARNSRIATNSINVHVMKISSIHGPYQDKFFSVLCWIGTQSYINVGVHLQ